MRTDAASIKQERVVHLVALRDELAVGIGRVSLLEALVKRVVDDLDFVAWDLEVALGIFLRKVANGKDAGRLEQHSLGEQKVYAPLEFGAGVMAVHVIEQVMHGDHVRTGDTLRLPEQMWNVQQIAAIDFQNAMQFEIAGQRKLVGMSRERR